ncbi:hypothetical protein MAL1_00164 [Bacteriophage DSS3_MAL1]|nr:hypothetical protein MAL1_00164 [Bacteriophage DSS3_MAL1]
MLTRAEEKQMRIEQMADHLIDDERYFDLDDPTTFLEWGYANMHSFYDAYTEDGRWVEDFDIDGLFDHWWDNERQQKEAA